MNIKVFDSELKVMEVLWEAEDKLPASQIAKRLIETVGWNPNTTYTIIKKLVTKGAIEREDPKFMCRALITKDHIQKQEISELNEKLFAGTPDVFLSAFLSNKKFTKEEMSKMKQLIEELDDGSDGA